MTPLFSTAYFPPIAYMAAMARFPKVEVEAKETFQKQTYRNRMEILTANGVHCLIVPVQRVNHSRTDEVGIDYRNRWNVIHFRTLTAAYAASPFFMYYKDDIEGLLMRHYERLIDLNDAALAWVLAKLKIQSRTEHTTDYRLECGEEQDYRSRFTPKKHYPTDGMKPYYQVFSDRMPFVPNLSVLDLLMNIGPEANNYLESLKI